MEQPDDLAAFWGPGRRTDRPPRVLGLFAHPDDEVFCVAGTIARCALDGADTAVVSLTRGEGGQIRDATLATRRTLGQRRVTELAEAARALGVGTVECLDLGDGTLADRRPGELADLVQEVVERYDPDVIVTFGPDGATGHLDHVTSSRVTQQALAAMSDPPRLLHARFPPRSSLLLDLLVQWLTSSEVRFSGAAGFGHALKLFADGSSLLGFAADHLRVEWFPAGSYVIEQGEPATELFCLLSGSVDIVVEAPDGRLVTKDRAGAGSFVGEDGLATGRPRNAHVVAAEDATCLVLAPRAQSRTATRGALLPTAPALAPADTVGFRVDVARTVDRKIAALAAHRTQYALDVDLLPRVVLDALLGTEHFTVVR